MSCFVLVGRARQGKEYTQRRQVGYIFLKASWVVGEHNRCPDRARLLLQPSTICQAPAARYHSSLEALEAVLRCILNVSQLLRCGDTIYHSSERVRQCWHTEFSQHTASFKKRIALVFSERLKLVNAWVHGAYGLPLF